MIKRLPIQKFLMTLSVGLIAGLGSPEIKPQTTVSIGTQIFCENQIVNVPVQVTGFMDVAAFTFYLSIDTLKVKFQSVVNPHPSLAGGILVSNFVSSLSQIIIVWQSINAATIENGKLFDIAVQFFQGPAGMNFLPSCEIVKSDLTVVQNVNFVDGELDNALRIFQQPQGVTVTEGETAIFSVYTYQSESLNYQWQVNNGTGWDNLVEAPPYQNVKTAQLLVVNAPVGLTNHWYRCRIAFDNCFTYTDSALLTVTPLAVISNPALNPLIRMSPLPATDKLCVEILGDICSGVLQLITMEGKLIKSVEINSTSRVLSLENVPKGWYLVALFQDNLPVATLKIPVQ